MKKEESVLNPLRFTTGLVIMAVLSATIYTLVSYGPRLFFPFFFVVVGTACCLTLFVFFPVMCVLVKTRRTGFMAVVATIATTSFVLFFVWNYASLSQSEDFVHGGRIMVVDGVINTSGYVKILVDSLVTSVISGGGASAFWLFALRKRKPRLEA